MTSNAINYADSNFNNKPKNNKNLDKINEIITKQAILLKSQGEEFSSGEWTPREVIHILTKYKQLNCYSTHDNLQIIGSEINKTSAQVRLKLIRLNVYLAPPKKTTNQKPKVRTTKSPATKKDEKTNLETVNNSNTYDNPKLEEVSRKHKEQNSTASNFFLVLFVVSIVAVGGYIFYIVGLAAIASILFLPIPLLIFFVLIGIFSVGDKTWKGQKNRESRGLS